jgi:hypothetical protein
VILSVQSPSGNKIDDKIKRKRQQATMSAVCLPQVKDLVVTQNGRTKENRWLQENVVVRLVNPETGGLGPGWTRGQDSSNSQLGEARAKQH